MMFGLHERSRRDDLLIDAILDIEGNQRVMTQSLDDLTAAVTSLQVVAAQIAAKLQAPAVPDETVQVEAQAQAVAAVATELNSALNGNSALNSTGNPT